MHAEACILQFVSTQVGSGLEIDGEGVFGKCYCDAVACVWHIWFLSSREMYGSFLQAAGAYLSKTKCDYSIKIICAIALQATVEG